ncbi:MAG: hypothetical protein WA268_14315 [Xanthobacteraceae bacterium]
MSVHALVTDTDLSRARSDPAFRQKLLEQSLEALLASLQKLRQTSAPKDNAAAVQMREAVELAVRLAELIQEPAQGTAARPRGPI